MPEPPPPPSRPEGSSGEASADEVIAMTLGDVRSFHRDLVADVARLGIDVAPYPLSHLAYRCTSWPDYVERRDALETVSRANVETRWSGRPISKLLLRTPVPLGGRHELELIELIPPPHGAGYRMGMEHLGFVVGHALDAFEREHRERLTGRQDQGAFSQPLVVALDGGRLAKFHRLSLRAVVELEGGTFDGSHHVGAG